MKSGFAVLIGRSNVGKSTFLNTVVGQKLAIVTPKPQTTRHVIHGVVNDPRGQIVFVDTPGIFLDGKGPLTGKLIEKVIEALEGIDAIVYMVDPTREIGPEERRTLAMIREKHAPKFLVINKIDIPLRKLPFLEDYRALKEEEEFAAVFEISARANKHIAPLLTAVFDALPEGEPLYPKEQFTNMDERTWIAEIIREKIFHTMGDEVPYSAMVRVEDIEEKPNIVVIHAEILTTDARYRKMIIGHGARKLKEMGTSARKELEAAMNKKVFLDLRVEKDTRWEEREI